MSGTNFKVATKYSLIEMAYIIYVDDIQEVLQHEVSFSVQHGTKVKHIIVLKRKNRETYIYRSGGSRPT